MVEPRQYSAFKGLSEDTLIAEIMSRDQSIDNLLETVDKLKIQLNYFTKKTFASASEKSSVILANEMQNNDTYLTYEEVGQDSQDKLANPPNNNVDGKSEIIAT